MSLLRVTLQHEGREYVIEDDHDWTEEGADYMWSEGNFSCDCNRRLFIARQTDPDGDSHFPCGETVELVRLELRGKVMHP